MTVIVIVTFSLHLQIKVRQLTENIIAASFIDMSYSGMSRIH